MAPPALNPAHAIYYAIGDRHAPVELVLEYDDSVAGLRGLARTYSRPAERNLGRFEWIPLADRDEALEAAASLTNPNPSDALLSLEHRVQSQLIT